MKYFIGVFLLCVQLHAAVPEKLITENIAKKLDAISTPESWKAFVSENEKLFPKIDKESGKAFVSVQREELNIDGASVTLGVGYRQILVKAPLAKIKRILNSPELFKSLYGLDAPANVDEVRGPANEPVKTFKARIYKQVPLVPNQDYTLEYSNTEGKDLFLQRAKLVKDNERFALRDNLTVLESVKEGTVIREVSIIYALRWYVRFFGPSVREVTNKELVKISDSMKCLAELNSEPTEESAADCWNKVTSL